MADYSLYYVPLTSITTQSNTFPTLDTTTSSRYGNTIELTGPTTVMQMEDTESDGTLNDDLDFDTQLLTQPLGTLPAGSGVEFNYYYNVVGDDGSSFTVYVVAIGSSAVADNVTGLVSEQHLKPGVTYTIVGHSSLYNVPYTALVCFAGGTRITTAEGERDVADLEPGEEIETLDHGLQELRWIGQRVLSSAELLTYQNLRPIRIEAGALGDGLPKRDLRVSPQHRILVRSKIAQRMFEADEVLVPATALTSLPGISRDDSLEPVAYYHLLFDQHEVIWSEGAATESLYIGPEALKALGEDAIREISALFPELLSPKDEICEPSRPLVPGARARRLAFRHVKNGKQLQPTA